MVCIVVDMEFDDLLILFELFIVLLLKVEDVVFVLLLEDEWLLFM